MLGTPVSPPKYHRAGPGRPENRSLAAGISYFMTTGRAIVATLSVGALGDVVGLRSALIAAAAIASGPGVAS